MTTSVYETVADNGEIQRTSDDEIAEKWTNEEDRRVTAYVAGDEA